MAALWFYLGFLDTWNYRNLSPKFDDHASPWASPDSANTVLREYKNAQGAQPSLIGTLVEWVRFDCKRFGSRCVCGPSGDLPPVFFPPMAW